MKLQSVLL